MAIPNLVNKQNKNTTVMLVEDSAVVRGMVRKWLENVPNIEVLDSADNGQIAINKVGILQPDIIILDIEMPVMDGITALPMILQKCPKAKVLIASTLSRKNAEVTLKAMSLGASDYIAKPSFTRDGNDARNEFQQELIRKVTGLSPRQTSIPIISKNTGDSSWAPMPNANSTFSFRKKSLIAPRILAIGSSTGGPAALTKLFEDLKGKINNIPIMVTQHMPPTFTALLGEKLARVSGIKGGEAIDQEPIIAGRLYVAPGGFHMRVGEKDGIKIVQLDERPPINHCRPAVDPLFESIAEHYGNSALVSVLTGMGSDGANGAVAIAHCGGTVFAQDEASSVVWGMPGATALAGVCTALVDINRMGEKLSEIIK
jgi:two-component system chemotaxis response regulator CheB